MAGFDKVKYNDTSLYIYNRSNPISDDRVNQQLQWNIHLEINKKPSFKKIKNYKNDEKEIQPESSVSI